MRVLEKPVIAKKMLLMKVKKCQKNKNQIIVLVLYAQLGKKHFMPDFGFCR